MGDSIFKEIFGSSIKEIREKNISKRESIERVKKLKKAKEAGMHPAGINQEAKKLSKELGVSYEDAVEYIKDEKKSAARKATLRKVGGFLGQVGQRAREDTARRYHQPPAKQKKEEHMEPPPFVRRSVFPTAGMKFRKVRFP